LPAELTLDETERVRGMARAESFLAATHDEFVANIERTKQYFAGQPEAGVLAEKGKRHANN